MILNGEIDPVTLEQLERLARSHPRSGREAQAKASALRTLEAAVSAGLASDAWHSVGGARPGRPRGASGGAATDAGAMARPTSSASLLLLVVQSISQDAPPSPVLLSREGQWRASD
jgi:hypothetical protein